MSKLNRSLTAHGLVHSNINNIFHMHSPTQHTSPYLPTFPYTSQETGGQSRQHSTIEYRQMSDYHRSLFSAVLGLHYGPTTLLTTLEDSSPGM